MIVLVNTPFAFVFESTGLMMRQFPVQGNFLCLSSDDQIIIAEFRNVYIYTEDGKLKEKFEIPKDFIYIDIQRLMLSAKGDLCLNNLCLNNLCFNIRQPHLNNSRYPGKTEFNNYFIIHMDYYRNIDLITTKKSFIVSGANVATAGKITFVQR